MFKENQPLRERQGFKENQPLRERQGFKVQFPDHIIKKMAPHDARCPNLAFLIARHQYGNLVYFRTNPNKTDAHHYLTHKHLCL